MGQPAATASDPMSFFRDASRKQARMRLALKGPTGTGKSISAIRIASGFANRIVVIDTERGSSDKYAGWRNRHAPHEPPLAFKVLELALYDPRNYIAAIKLAEQAGFDCIIIDSLSHAWAGKGGALELHDAATARAAGNSFSAWKDVTPLHNDLIDAICNSSAHVIVTMRTKMDHVMEDSPSGGKTVRKVGLNAVQRNDVEYEFDIIGNMDMSHRMVIEKTRWDEIDGLVIQNPGQDFGRRLATWLNEGDVAPRRIEPTQEIDIRDPVATFEIPESPAPVQAALETVDRATLDRITSLVVETEMTSDQVAKAMERRKVSSFAQLSPEQGRELVEKLENNLDEMRFADRVAQGNPTAEFVIPEHTRKAKVAAGA